LFAVILLLQRQGMLLRRGAEADIYLTTWYDKKAISKIRVSKKYRHKTLDDKIRKHRTVHEANMLSNAKIAGIRSPFLYFVDPFNGEIIMEYVNGMNAKDVITPRTCFKIGEYAALLHTHCIIHNDLTTSNFIVDNSELVLLDFGLSYHSARIEDQAVDIRLFKRIINSAHKSIYKVAFSHFSKGYSSVVGEKRMNRILENVIEIENRGRYTMIS
jgi:TP53 regulating kinase-like protein